MKLDVRKAFDTRQHHLFREKASSFSSTMQPLAKDFENLDSLQILDVEVYLLTPLKD